MDKGGSDENGAALFLAQNGYFFAGVTARVTAGAKGARFSTVPAGDLARDQAPVANWHPGVGVEVST